MASLAYWQRKAAKRQCSLTLREGADGKWFAFVQRDNPARYSTNVQHFGALHMSLDGACRNALEKERTAPK